MVPGPDDVYLLNLNDLELLVEHGKIIKDAMHAEALQHVLMEGGSCGSGGSGGSEGNSSSSALASEIKEDAYSPLAVEEVERFRRWIAESHQVDKVDKDAPSETDAYIAATTKKCPTEDCPNRQSHFHGHSCHHVREGCSVCKQQYCYMCLCSAEMNRRDRGDDRYGMVWYGMDVVWYGMVW